MNIEPISGIAERTMSATRTRLGSRLFGALVRMKHNAKNYREWVSSLVGVTVIIELADDDDETSEVRCRLLFFSSSTLNSKLLHLQLAAALEAVADVKRKFFSQSSSGR
eukprot:COSAG05_NODE_2379_length_3154_cov_3.363993_1_plen_109_part_00